MTKQQILQKIASKAYDGMYKEAVDFGFGDPDAAWYDKLNWFGTGDTAREELEKKRTAKMEADENTRQDKRMAQIVRNARDNGATVDEINRQIKELPPDWQRGQSVANANAERIKRQAIEQRDAQLRAQGINIPEKQYIRANQPQQTPGQTVFGGRRQGFGPSAFEVQGITGSPQPAPNTQSWYNPSQGVAASTGAMNTLAGLNSAITTRDNYQGGYQPPQPQSPSMDDVNAMRGWGQHSNTPQQRARFQLSGRASGIPGVPSGKRLNRRQWSRRSVPVYAQGYNY